jgi:hypothetical protein
MSKLVKKDSRWIGRDKTRFEKGVEQELSIRSAGIPFGIMALAN